jgi:Radical SAM superfamily
VDDDLLALMASAGCTGIFFGIETGSQRLQKTINKKLDLAEARRRIAAADRNGINTTVALIVGFPEETRDDLRDTIHFFMDCLRFDHAEPQCSLLAPLAATPVYEEHKDHLIFDRIFSDMSHQSWGQDPVETGMIEAHPDIFPNFYAVPTVRLARTYIKEVMNFATYLATWFRWLPVALLQDSGDLLNVFERWQRWRVERSPSESDEDTGWTPYYSHRRFHREFLEFVQTCYLPEMARAGAAVAAVAQAEAARAPDGRKPIVDDIQCLDASSVPYRRNDLIAIDVDVNYKELIECLKEGRDLCHVSASDAVIVFDAADDRLDVWQLPPLSASLLRLCDGRRTVQEIASAFQPPAGQLDGIPAGAVCVFGLTQLREDGVIGFSASPLMWEEDPAVRVPRYSLPPQAGNTQQPWPPRE